MHILAAFFALLLSFSQASAVRKTETQPQFTPTVTASALLPDEASDYAGNGCTSCQKTNAPSSAR